MQRTSAEVQALADAADVAVITMIRYLAGLPVRARIGRRCEAAVAAAEAVATTTKRSRRAA